MEANKEHLIQCQVMDPDGTQCPNNWKVKVHNTHTNPTYVCTKHYKEYQSKGLILGMPTLITFNQGELSDD